MPKGRGLTGGTGDINPQFLHATLNESAPNTFTTAPWHLPTLKIGTSSTRAQTIELIKIFYDTNFPDAQVAPGHGHISIALKWGGIPTSFPTFDDPTVIFHDICGCEAAIGGTGFSYAFPWMKNCFDLTDGAGHGLILFTDVLHMCIEGTAQTASKYVHLQLYFRFKNVGLTEFLTGLTMQAVR